MKYLKNKCPLRFPSSFSAPGKCYFHYCLLSFDFGGYCWGSVCESNKVDDAKLQKRVVSSIPFFCRFYRDLKEKFAPIWVNFRTVTLTHFPKSDLIEIFSLTVLCILGALGDVKHANKWCNRFLLSSALLVSSLLFVCFPS